MNRRWLTAFIILLIIALFAWLWRPMRQYDIETRNFGQALPSPTPLIPVDQKSSPGTLSPANVVPAMNFPDVSQQQRFMSLFHTPISFFGKVVDEKGLPVPGAIVKMRVADKPWTNGTLYERLSDEKGLFTITGINGAELFVKVAKDGYRQTNTSRKSIRYAGPPLNTIESIPTRDTPVLFVLNKQGVPAALIYISERPIKVAKNGSPVEVSLKTGRLVPPGQGDLLVEVWTEEARRDSEGRYPWRCRLSVPGGGLLEQADPQTFEAPVEGYLETAEIASSQERWSSRSEKFYFVALRNGSFARLKFRLRTDGEHYFVIESFLNPEPGSRNLTYDQSLRVATPKRY